jgi:hypothetical protein
MFEKYFTVFEVKCKDYFTALQEYINALQVTFEEYFTAFEVMLENYKVGQYSNEINFLLAVTAILQSANTDSL